jgi:hypothetical protein
MLTLLAVVALVAGVPLVFRLADFLGRRTGVLEFLKRIHAL